MFEMKAKAVKIGKDYFAPSDFSWLDITEKNPDEEGPREAKEIERDMYCVFDFGLAPQIGFAKRKDLGVRGKVYAIAPWIVSRYKYSDMIGVFIVTKDPGRLKDLEGMEYYGILVSGGLIQVDLMSDYTGMKKWLDEQTLLYENAKLVLPEGWGTPSERLERSMFLDVLISASEDDLELYCPFIGIRDRQISLIRTAVISAVVATAFFLFAHYEHGHKKVLVVAKAITKAVTPSVEYFPVASVMQGCRNLFRSVRPEVHGWVLKSFSCIPQSNQVVLKWSRVYGTIDALRREENRGIWSLDMDKATEIVSYPFSSVSIKSNRLDSYDNLLSKALSYFQKINTKVLLSNSGVVDDLTHVGVKGSRLSAKFEVYPGDLKGLSYPGISVSRIEYVVPDDVWNFEGEIYYVSKKNS